MAETTRLHIRMAKREGKPPLLVCTRPNGETTGAEMRVGAAHDLMHLAVESVLGLEGAFFGLIAGGMAIEEFEAAAATKVLDIPEEAVLVEHAVNLLATELLSGQAWDDFGAQLRGSASGGRRPIAGTLEITADELRLIRETASRLLHRWHSLPDGDSLELEFPLAITEEEAR